LTALLAVQLLGSTSFFLAQEFVRLYRLPSAFRETVVVGSRFHLKPLLPLLSGDGRFYVLAISQNGVRLLQGTRFGISPVDLKGVPRNLAQALLAHDRDNMLTFHTRPAGGLGSWGAIFSGHGVGIDDKKEDLLQYFQKIDRGLHPLLRNEHAPLVLAAVDYFLPLYRKANTYPHLLEEGFTGSPEHRSNQELHDRAWALVEPFFAEKKKKALARFQQLAGTGRTSCASLQIVPAAFQGQVETLFVALDVERWGKFDPSTGRVEEHEKPGPGDEDLLSLAAVNTLAHGKTVYALQAEQVPQNAPMAAVFCLPLAKRE
jgi:hypothetical protein